MEEFDNHEEMPAVPVRPKMLSILCVLTFISTGLGIIGSLVTPAMQEQMIAFLKSNPNMDENQMADTLKVLQAGWGYYLLCALLAAGSLTGAILMWRLNKNGFHFYAFSNLALLFVPTLVLGLALSWSAIFLTVAFIAMYAMNLRHMH